MKVKIEKRKSIGRPKSFEKDEVLKLAMNQFWEYGYDSTSLDELLKAMGIKKSSFYSTFKSKEDIFSQSLDLYREETFCWMNDLKSEIGAKKALIYLFKSTIEELQDSGKIKGCLLVNSAKECYDKHSVLSKQISIEYNEYVEFVTLFIAKAQKNNEIKTKQDPKKLAIRILSMYNGVVSMIQAGADINVVNDLINFIEEILE